MPPADAPRAMRHARPFPLPEAPPPLRASASRGQRCAQRRCAVVVPAVASYRRPIDRRTHRDRGGDSSLRRSCLRRCRLRLILITPFDAAPPESAASHATQPASNAPSETPPRHAERLIWQQRPPFFAPSAPLQRCGASRCRRRRPFRLAAFYSNSGAHGGRGYRWQGSA